MLEIFCKNILLNPTLVGLSIWIPLAGISAAWSQATEADVNSKSQAVDPIAVTDYDAILDAADESFQASPSVGDLDGSPGLHLPSMTRDIAESDSFMGQVTDVNQLADVSPTDWAFQALQALIQRWGCIAGYPDGTFKGQRSATRFELAAALNACLDSAADKFATKEELEVVKRLQEEFASELAVLRGRVDQLEARTDLLEDQQFSTLTKLKGEVVMAGGYPVDNSPLLTNSGGVVRLDPSPGDEPDNVFAGYRVRLNFDTSFTGSDRLRVRLQARDIPELQDATGTRLSRLAFDGDNGRELTLNEMNYQFKPVERLRLKFDFAGGEFNDNVNVLNPYLESSGSGSLSRFGRFNPIYRQGDGGAGVTLSWEPNDIVDVEIGYLADEPGSATDGGTNVSSPRGGLFLGSYAVLGQLVFTPIQDAKFQFALTYVRSFDEAGNVNVTGSTGDAPTAIGTTTRRPFGNGVDTEQDHFGFQFTYQPLDWFNWSGWVGYSKARVTSPGVNTGGFPSGGKVNLINWASAFTFPDLLQEGNVAAIIVGQQPRIIDATIGGVNIANFDGSDPNWFVDAQYKYRVNKNIEITPGVIININPNNTSENDTIFIPVIRTTFKF